MSVAVLSCAIGQTCVGAGRDDNDAMQMLVPGRRSAKSCARMQW